MKFRLLSTIIQERGLQNPSLGFLIPDNALYDTLLFQPKEDIKITDNSIRVINRDRIIQKFNRFFSIAANEGVDLAITPEYSCPWDAIENLLKTDSFPHDKNMWIVGCESILPNDLKEFISYHSDIEWIYDDILVENHLGSDNFLNPIVFLFNVLGDNQENRKVCLVQFKTEPLGGSDWEQRNLLAGNDIYIIENEGESIKLVTLICSDVLVPNFLNSLPAGHLTDAYLFVHIQLNSHPDHHDFSEYRQSIFKQTDNKEVICLNWGRGIKIRNSGLNSSQYGGSAIYIKSNDLILSDERLNHNHKLGLYYSYWQNRRSSIYYFNYDEYVYRIKHTKPSQVASLSVSQRRIGPEMNDVKQWNNDWIDVKVVDDGFCAFCEDFESNNNVSLDILKNNDLLPIDKERLLILSVGEIGGNNWFDVKEAKYFIVDDREYVQRITFTHHPDIDIGTNRRNLLTKYAKLKNLINNPDYFPINISDLKNNCQIQYRPHNFKNEYNLNLYSINGESAPATVAYMGEVDKSRALAVKDRMMDLFVKDQNEKRVVVWYLDLNNNIHPCSSDEKPRVMDNPSKSSRSITKTR